MGDRGGKPWGKGRGRARGQEQTRPKAGPSTEQLGAWGRRPGHSQGLPGGPSQHGSSSTPYARSTSSSEEGQSAGRGSRIGVRGDAQSAKNVPEPMDVAIGGGGDAASLGRGAMRGRRVLPAEILFTRPKDLKSKKGKSGTPVLLTANYFKMLSTTDWCLYQYRVDFSPEEDRTVVRKGLVKLHGKTLGAYIFDGTVLYTSHRLPDELELFSTRQSDQTQIRINIRLVGDMVKGDHHYLQFFNIIMRKCLDKLHLQLVGRNYFDAESKVEVREYKLELWPGYLTSIRQHEMDILMCAEITHKVMRQQTLLDILNDCYQEYGHGYKQRFASQIIGLVVLTDYNNNTYRVDDVDFETTPQSTFKLRTQEDISYKDYYRTKYQINIRNNSQPMLVSRSKPRDRRAGQAELIYLVPELCRATGLTDDMRNNYHLMQALATHTRVGPQTRIQKLLAFNKRLRSERSIDQELTEWNLKLDNKLIEIPGRVLSREKILFGSNASADSGNEANWTREFRNRALLHCSALRDWALIVSNRSKRDAQAFIGMLVKVGTGMRFQIAQPRIIDIADDRSGTYTDTLEQIMSRSNPQLIFCIVSNNRSDRYSAIKKKCCVDRPVPTQVFLAKNLNKGGMSIATKVAIQMNCKIGGAPWTVEIPLTSTMVVGFDVCHDTNTKGRDYGAIVASLDKYFSRYYSAVSAHTNGEELSNDLSTNLCKALHKYREINNELPSRIIIYRDGVGEGQIPYVYEHEVENLKSKLAQLYGSPAAVKMAFIIVTKRLNTRIFLNNANPSPGTVIDDVITNPVKYDFLIVSQHVQQGTVSPTSYSVIADTVELDADKLQRLTYKLTHMYYNWSGTVRVPAPCQYAHKLAFLVAQSIHRSPSTHLESLLYFL